MKRMMYGLFAHQGVHGAVPDKAIRVLGKDSGQLALEILHAFLVRGLELDDA